MSAAAFFDVDGTLTRTTTLDPLNWYQRVHLAPLRYTVWTTGLWLQAPYYWLLDKRSRAAFNALFYRRYKGLRIADLRQWHGATFACNLQRTLFAQAVECVREHQRQGHRIVLLTGGLACVMQPLADFLGADGLIALHLREQDGLCTGELDGPAIAGAEKARLLRDYAEKHGIDLGQSFAYGDSPSDVSMLEAAGHAVAVRPGRRLRNLAQARGWRIVRWR